MLTVFAVLTALVPPAARADAPDPDRPGARPETCPGGALAEHAPVKIATDADFTAANGVIGGTGTLADPYVIACLAITVPGTGIGLDISKTSAPFIVRDVRPFASEHACRLRDPADFDPDSFRRTQKDHEGKEYFSIDGRLTGSDARAQQALRYPPKTWDATAARSHCEAHAGILFEPVVVGSQPVGTGVSVTSTVAGIDGALAPVGIEHVTFSSLATGVKVNHAGPLSVHDVAASVLDAAFTGNPTATGLSLTGSAKAQSVTIERVSATVGASSSATAVSASGNGTILVRDIQLDGRNKRGTGVSVSASGSEDQNSTVQRVNASGLGTAIRTTVSKNGVSTVRDNTLSGNGLGISVTGYFPPLPFPRTVNPPDPLYWGGLVTRNTIVLDSAGTCITGGANVLTIDNSCKGIGTGTGIQPGSSSSGGGVGSLEDTCVWRSLATQNVIENVEIGIDTDDPAPCQRANDNLVLNSRQGIRIGQVAIVKGNRVIGCDIGVETFAAIANSMMSVIEDNVVLDSKGNGMDLTGCDRCTIRNNTVIGSAGAAMMEFAIKGLNPTNLGRSNLYQGNHIGRSPWGIVLEFPPTGASVVEGTDWVDGHQSFINFADANSIVDAGSDAAGVAGEPASFYDYIAKVTVGAHRGGLFRKDAALANVATEIRWDFGDGHTRTFIDPTQGKLPPLVQHTYTSPGRYTATLTVTAVDNTGQQYALTDTVPVSIQEA